MDYYEHLVVKQARVEHMLEHREKLSPGDVWKYEQVQIAVERQLEGHHAKV